MTGSANPEFSYGLQMGAVRQAINEFNFRPYEEHESQIKQLIFSQSRPEAINAAVSRYYKEVLSDACKGKIEDLRKFKYRFSFMNRESHRKKLLKLKSKISDRDDYDMGYLMRIHAEVASCYKEISESRRIDFVNVLFLVIGVIIGLLLGL